MVIGADCSKVQNGWSIMDSDCMEKVMKGEVTVLQPFSYGVGKHATRIDIALDATSKSGRFRLG